MFRVHSKLSKKILKKFLFIYTLIFFILALLLLTGTSLFFLYKTGKNISSRTSLITDVWDEFETTRQEQVYTLISSNDLINLLMEYYRKPSPSARERVNLCLSGFQASDSGLHYLMMEDEQHNTFHSLNSFSTGIQNHLQESSSYQKSRKNGGSCISPVEEYDSELYCAYTDLQTIYGHSFVICFCYDMQNIVRNIKNAGTGLDSIQIYNTYGERLFSTDMTKSGFYPESERSSGLFHCIFSPDGIAVLNKSYHTMISTVGTISYQRLMMEFLSLLVILLAVYFIPIIIALLCMIPANDKLLKPIGKLSREVQSFSIGMQPSIPYDSDDELGELSHSFFEMAQNINKQSLDLSEKEREKAVTYYKLLTTQLDPHFIYNTMNIINILARQEAYEDIIKVNTALTRVLRERLNTQNTTFETIQNEIEALKQYQLIMDYRYHNQVVVEYEIDETILDMKIPKNILQPLMENAYYHGLSTDQGEILGNIDVLIYPLEEELVIEISDNGKGFSPQRLQEIRDNLLHATFHAEKEAHIGMENIYRRISYLYEDRFSMDIQSEEGHGSAIILTFPLEPFK